jgi:hypothetical protein
MTQIASDPTDALQAGIFALLNGDTTLGALITGIYDGVPEDVEPAYVVIGEVAATPDGSHSAHGRQTSATIHTWTRAQSFKTANDIGARVAALLTHQHAALDAQVSGHAVGIVAHEFSQNMVDAEPGIRHRVDRFRIYTSQEA